MSDIKKYRDIILYKAYAELKGESLRSYLGMLWWVLEPIMYMAAFYLVMTSIKGRGGLDFVIFLLLGLVPWKWFASTISMMCGSIQGNAGLMRQVYLPKWIFLFITVTKSTFKFSIIFVLLLIFLLVTGHEVTTSWLLLPVVLLFQFIVMFGIGAILASVIPIIPDIRQVVDNVMLLLFFLSGIFFDLNEIADETKKDLLLLNPMATMIDSYRRLIQRDEMLDFNMLAIWGIVGIVSTITAILIIRRFDRIYPRILLR